MGAKRLVRHKTAEKEPPKRKASKKSSSTTNPKTSRCWSGAGGINEENRYERIGPWRIKVIIQVVHLGDGHVKLVDVILTQTLIEPARYAERAMVRTKLKQLVIPIP